MEETILKSLFEKYGGTYRRESDYLIPNLSLPVEERPVGVYVQRHLQYLQEHCRLTYINLLTSGRLNAYLKNIDTHAQDMLFRLVKEFAEKQNITEQLKVDSPMEWVQRMNNIRYAAEEIVHIKLIYS